MAIPSFSAFHDEGINLEGLLEILSPENNLVLADDMMVSDGNGIILRVSETYEKNFGFAHDSIVGKSAFDLEADGTFTPCITAEVIRRRKKISATQTINHTHKNVMTVGIPLFDANGELKYAVCFNTVSMEQINSIQRNYRRMQDSLQHYSQEIAELRTRATSTNLLFKSAPMQRLWTLMQNTANTRANILITGETGVGKSAIAKAIHKMSNRANGPFIEVNCAVLHENLIESELFGYEKGAFTGASSSGKIGKIELANHGTLFLDEIGELPAHIQSKLLQLIQEKTIERLSGTQKIELDFRLIVATNRNLEEAVQRGLFRSDLFYRLNVIRIHIPPPAAAEGGHRPHGPPVPGPLLRGVQQVPHLQPPLSGFSGAVRLARQRAPAGEPDGEAGNHCPGPHSGHSCPAAGVHRRRVGPCGAASRRHAGRADGRLRGPNHPGFLPAVRHHSGRGPGAGHLPGHSSPQDCQIRDRPGVRGGSGP